MAKRKRLLARKQMEKRLQTLGKNIVDAVLDELSDGADLIVAEQKGMAPRDTGVLASTIHRSKVRVGKKTATVTIRAGGKATHAPGNSTRPGGFDYAVEQEFGNRDMPTNPFFYPPIRKNSAKIKARVRKAFGSEVKDF